jgi:hypothetical protein
MLAECVRPGNVTRRIAVKRSDVVSCRLQVREKILEVGRGLRVRRDIAKDSRHGHKIGAGREPAKFLAQLKKLIFLPM